MIPSGGIEKVVEPCSEQSETAERDSSVRQQHMWHKEVPTAHIAPSPQWSGGGGISGPVPTLPHSPSACGNFSSPHSGPHTFEGVRSEWE